MREGKKGQKIEIKIIEENEEKWNSVGGKLGKIEKGNRKGEKSEI